jgi:hypothetical protein
MDPKTIVEPFYADIMEDFSDVRIDVHYNLLYSFVVFYLKVTGDVTITTTFIPSKNGGNNQNG